MLKRLTYRSTADFALTDEGVAAMVDQAGDKNALMGVTGVLLFNGTHFMQSLEGRSGVVDDLYAKIKRDPRHYGVETLELIALERRRFEHYPMLYARIAHALHGIDLRGDALSEAMYRLAGVKPVIA